MPSALPRGPPDPAVAETPPPRPVESQPAARNPAPQLSVRPSRRSVSRRSRLVGRPEPRSRRGMDATISRGGGAGLRSIKHCAAIGGPTRLVMTRSTMTMRSTPPARTRTSSPGRTGWAGLAVAPFTRTWPPRQASAAADLVLKRRTAHVQESTRAWFGAVFLVVGWAGATLRPYGVPSQPCRGAAGCRTPADRTEPH